MKSDSLPPHLFYGLLLFVAAIAFYGGIIGGAQLERNDREFSDQDLATAQRVISQLVIEARERDDPLLKEAQELLSTIEELQDNRQDRGLSERE